MFRSLIEELRHALDEGKMLLPWNRPDKETRKKNKKNLKDIERLDGYRRTEYKSGDPKAVIPWSGKRTDGDEVPTTKSYTWRDAGTDKKFGS